MANLRQRVERVYVHIDLDVLDSSETPANEFPAPGGLSLEQVEAALHLVSQHFMIVGGGLASYDPAYDSSGRALRASIQILTALLAASAV